MMVLLECILIALKMFFFIYSLVEIYLFWDPDFFELLCWKTFWQIFFGERSFQTWREFVYVCIQIPTWRENVSPRFEFCLLAVPTGSKQFKRITSETNDYRATSNQRKSTIEETTTKIINFVKYTWKVTKGISSLFPELCKILNPTLIH